MCAPVLAGSSVLVRGSTVPATWIPKDDSACVGAWYMNGTSTNDEVDRSGEGYDLSTSNDLETSSNVPTGYSGASRYINDASGEVLSIADTSAPGLDISGVSAKLTVCAWVSLDTNNVYREVVSKWDNTNGTQYQIIRLSSNVFSFGVSSDGSTTTGSINSTTITSTATWYHVCGVMDGTNLEIYVNGTRENYVAYSSGIADGSGDFTIGLRADGNVYGEGYYDEVIVFNRALSSDEINTIYTDGISGDKGGSD